MINKISLVDIENKEIQELIKNHETNNVSKNK